MYPASLELLETTDGAVMVDVNTFRVFGLSAAAYDVLTRLKAGATAEAVGAAVGHETVAAVLRQLARLQSESQLSPTRLRTRDEAWQRVTRLLESPAAPAEAVLMVAQTCNLACRYCYGGRSGQFGAPGRMDTATAEHVLRYVLESGRRRDFQKVVFLGGEPLLNLPVIRHVVGLWKRWQPDYPNRELFFSLTTNGTLVDQEAVRFLKEEHVGVCLSIDGPKDMHDANRVTTTGQGSYDRVMATVDLMRREAMPFSVRVTLTRQTDWRRLREFLKQANFDIEYIAPVDYPRETCNADYQFDLATFKSFGEELRTVWREGADRVSQSASDSFESRQLSMAFKNLREYDAGCPFRCMAGISLISFDCNGVIYPCQRMVGRAGYEIGTVEHGVDRDKLLGLYRRFIDSSEACDSCWAVQRCRRRCLAQRASGDGQFDPLPEAVCDIYRDNFQAALTFGLELQRLARDRKENLEDVLSRYDTERLMEEHRARTSRP